MSSHLPLPSYLADGLIQYPLDRRPEHETERQPERQPVDAVLREDASRYCQRLARTHYENFSVASWLLPRTMRRHFAHLYAYCRAADDLADETPSADQAIALLDDWQSQLDATYRGGPFRHKIFVALHETSLAYDLPRQPLVDLLDAFRQDQTVTRYATMAGLIEYCRRSANPVGRLVLKFADVDDAARLALSDAVCTGLQLTNHWQDVAADAKRGRIYLPEEDQERFAVDESMILAGRVTPALKQLIAFEVQQARHWLMQGMPLVAQVPRWLAADVRLFAEGGLAGLRAIERAGHDVWTSGRPAVGRTTKALLLAKALWWRLFPCR
jgi:squalene synthase HpnC